MRALTILLALAAAAFVAGCASTVERAKPLAVECGGAEMNSSMLVAELLDVVGTRVQSVEGSWRDRTFSAECVIKCDGEKFTCVFLAPMMRLATLTLTRPYAVNFERAAALPDSFEPEWALFDLALVNLPADRLGHALGRRFAVRQSGDVVGVFGPDGEVAVRTKRADGSVHVVNRVYGYEYVVREIAQ